MELVRLAYYPFLPEVRQVVREAGIGLDELLSSTLYSGVRSRAQARVRAAMGAVLPPVVVVDERVAILELMSVPLARMLVVYFGDKILRDKYAAMEAGQVQQHLNQDPQALEPAVDALGISVAATREGKFRMHMADYLRLAPGEPAWKLVVVPVVKGHVLLDRFQVNRLVREALAKRIAEELEAETKKGLSADLKAAIERLAVSLQPDLEEARKHWNTGDFGPVQPHLFPPCIKEIFDALRRAENVAHHGRFAFATFLHTVGWNSEQILDYLSTTPNFDREKSRYQIEHVSGDKGVQAYTPPGCATMQTNGVCPLDKRDGLCHKIKHPLQYYRAQLRFQKRDLDAAGASDPTEEGANTASSAGAGRASNESRTDATAGGAA